jgi:hypothetical protein
MLSPRGWTSPELGPRLTLAHEALFPIKPTPTHNLTTLLELMMSKLEDKCVTHLTLRSNTAHN